MDNRFKFLEFSASPSQNAFGTWSKVGSGDAYYTDTTLRLVSSDNSSLYSSNLKGTKRKWNRVDGIDGAYPASLALGLRQSASSSDSSKRSSPTVCTLSSTKETGEESSIDLGFDFQLHLGRESTPRPKDQAVASSKALSKDRMFDLQLTLSVGPSDGAVTDDATVAAHQSCFSTAAKKKTGRALEEGSTSFGWKCGSHALEYQYTSEVACGFPSNQKNPGKGDSVLIADLSSNMLPMPTSPAACTSGITQQPQRNTSTKKCHFQGCVKGGRGASGLCIAHGGGRRCHKAGCQKGAEGRTIYCKAHGGGRRCEYLGCTKSAEGRTDFCIAHGGGRRCCHENCNRAARGKSGLCIKHGGGKRCQKENCTKSAEGYSGLCISHGGGRRCQYPECKKGAQGSTIFCKAHGGGKRCTFSGCNKGAEGSTPFCKGHGGGKRCSFEGGCTKSVHGGTQFCVAHGGGKRCAIADCTKSARGRTDCCVRHGGGKRCRSDGCGKSAQGSTDFCKAHGGGNRCSWGQAGSDLGVGGLPCDRFARGKIGLCAAHSALVQDRHVHGGAMMQSVPSPSTHEKMKGIAVEEDSVWNGLGGSAIPLQSSLVSLPEGRVHGVNLLSMLASSEGVGSRVHGGTSEHGMQYTSWL